MRCYIQTLIRQRISESSEDSVIIKNSGFAEKRINNNTDARVGRSRIQQDRVLPEKTSTDDSRLYFSRRTQIDKKKRWSATDPKVWEDTPESIRGTPKWNQSLNLDGAQGSSSAVLSKRPAK